MCRAKTAKKGSTCSGPNRTSTPSFIGRLTWLRSFEPSAAQSASPVAGRSSTTVIFRCETGRSSGNATRLRSSSSLTPPSRAIASARATSAATASSSPSGPP